MSFFELLDYVTTDACDKTCRALSNHILLNDFEIDRKQVRIGDADEFTPSYVAVANNARILSLLGYGYHIRDIVYAPGDRDDATKSAIHAAIELKCYLAFRAVKLIDAGSFFVSQAKQAYKNVKQLYVHSSQRFDDNFALNRIYPGVQSIIVSAAVPFAMASIARPYMKLVAIEFVEGAKFLECSHILATLDANAGRKLKVTMDKTMTQEALTAFSERPNLEALSVQCYGYDFLSRPQNVHVRFGFLKEFTLVDATVLDQNRFRQLPLGFGVLERLQLVTYVELANMEPFIVRFSGTLTQLAMPRTQLHPSYATRLFGVIDALPKLEELTVTWLSGRGGREVQHLLTRAKLRKVTFVCLAQPDQLEAIMASMGAWKFQGREDLVQPRLTYVKKDAPKRK